MNLGEIFSEIAATTDMSSTGVKLIFRPTSPIQVVRFGVNVITDALTGTFSLQLEQRTHNAAGTLAAAVAVGGISCDGTAHIEGTVVYAEPIDSVIVKAGDEIILDLDDAAAAGDGHVWLQYQKMNWDNIGINAEFSDAVRTNRMFDGSTAI